MINLKNANNHFLSLLIIVILIFIQLNYAQPYRSIISSNSMELLDNFTKFNSKEEFRNTEGLKVINSLGVKSGLSIFNGHFFIMNDSSADMGYRNGPFIGLEVELFKVNFISHFIRSHYYQSGGDRIKSIYNPYEDAFVDYTIDYRFDYIGIGYSICFFVVPVKNFIPYISLGPNIDLLLNHEIKFKEIDGELHRYDFNELNKLGLGITFLSGINVPIKFISIITEYSYTLNLTPFYGGKSSAHKTNGHWILLGIRYNF